MPLFTALLENGRNGYTGDSRGVALTFSIAAADILSVITTDIVRRNCDFADCIARWLRDPEAGGQWYELVNGSRSSSERAVPLNIVLFRGKNNSRFPPEDPTSAGRLVKAINDTRRIFVTITSWEGIGAVRIAVSNWRTANGEGGVEASSELVEVKGVLSEVMQ